MANFYRVKDGNWNLADSWATTSGGATYHAAPPTSSDDVFFDANTPTGTHTVNTTANTLSLDFTGFTGTLAGQYSLDVYGSMTMGAGMTNNYLGQITFRPTSNSCVIRSNGVTLNSRLRFYKTGGTFQLYDDLTVGGMLNSISLTLTAGTFDPNNKTVTVNSSQYCTIQGAFTFYNFIRTSGAAPLADLTLKSNITVTNTLTITGNSAINRIFVKSDTLGTARTLTAATVSVTNADFQDITGAGAGSWDLSAITGGSGDCGGNTGITFTTADDWYWHADTGNVSDYSKWYTATNGGGSQMASTRVPLPQDTLKFDANSFDSASQTITQNMSRIGSIDFTGATNTPTFTTSTAASVYGSITLISGMTLTASTQTYTFEGRGSYTLDSGGKDWYKYFYLNAPGGTLTLQSNLSILGNGLQISSGTFSAVDGINNYNVYTRTVNISASCTLIMGSGIWEMYAVNLDGWTCSPTATINCGTSTIKYSGTRTANCKFVGGGKTYYNFWDNSSGAYYFTVTGSNTFNDFKIDAGREVRFTAGTNTTVTTFTAEGTDVAPITLTSNTTSAATLTKAGGGTITVKYCDISYLTATPAGTWLAYTTDGNVDSGNNTGWTFVSGDTRRRAAFIKFF